MAVNNDEGAQPYDTLITSKYNAEIVPKNHNNHDAHAESKLLLKLETKDEKRSRIISIIIVYFSVFLLSLGFSICLTGVWPYLRQVDPSADKTFLGWVIAANPLGQLILSPVVGWWSNKLNSIRLPSIVCMIIFVAGNVWFSFLEDIHVDNKKYWMAASRFIVGASSANITACRSYLSAATTERERTTGVALIALSQALGFILGPALQATLTPIGADWHQLGFGLTVNMYTAAGWINIILGVICVVLYLPGIFKESNIAQKEAQLQCEGLDDTQAWKHIKPNSIGMWSCLVAFFVTFLMFVLLETLATPLTMDQFGWTESEAIQYMGILMSVGGIISSIAFIVIGPLARKFDERKLLLILGFIPMVLAILCFFPFGTTYPPMAEHKNITELVFSDNFTEDYMLTTMPSDFFNETLIPLFDELPKKHHPLTGCPPEQGWCRYIPALKVEQLVTGYMLTTIGYPFCLSLIHAIYSKILGARPQGMYMSYLTGAGCLSRVAGPVFISYVYTGFGTYLTFGLNAVFIILSAIEMTVVYKHLRPMILPSKPDIERETRV